MRHSAIRYSQIHRSMGAFFIVPTAFSCTSGFLPDLPVRCGIPICLQYQAILKILLSVLLLE